MSSEPGLHQLDREAMFAEHVAIAERVQREVDAVVAAAAAKRSNFLERFVDRLQIDAGLERERARILRTLQSAPARRDALGRIHASRSASLVEPEGVDAADSAIERVVAA